VIRTTPSDPVAFCKIYLGPYGQGRFDCIDPKMFIFISIRMEVIIIDVSFSHIDDKTVQFGGDALDIIVTYTTVALEEE
jgi:hypothetical protein